MRHPIRRITAQTAALLALAGASSLAQAGEGGFARLSSEGDKVAIRCNPSHDPEQARCRVASLPGADGFKLVASRNRKIVKNGVVIGLLRDRAWQRADGMHIFGAQVQMNANPFDTTGLAFNVNDLFRQVLENRPVSIAYYQDTSKKALKKAGRTLQGLNEAPPSDDDDDDDDDDLDRRAPALAGDDDDDDDDDAGPHPQPTRDNAWVDFRIDANAAEPRGGSSADSPWVLVKTKAPRGFSVQPFAIRLLSSDAADSSLFTEIYLSGFKPN